ncbi:MAG: calcium/sodium antiporter [Saprospiraceae bacterium]|nr:calcium/sodium antiporter [Saprospiraceae bacterium]
MGDALLYFGLFAVSLTVLLKASDFFIDSAEKIGLSVGIPQFIIGVTIVAFGTSLPELATAIISVLKNESELVISTVIGSNVTNIALVLGLVAVVVKNIDLEYNIWHSDMPHLWGSAFMLWLVLSDYQVSIMESLLLLGGIVIFLANSFKSDDKEIRDDQIKTSWKTYALLLVGGFFVYLGADYTVFAIKKLSAIAGIESKIIGLSVVALGTSLPEIIVSLNAARKGKTSIAVGNVLGSNIFNTYMVVGLPALIGPIQIPDDINNFYLPLMLVMTVLFGLMSNNQNFSRSEGFILILFYIFFLAEMFKGF